MSWVCLRGKRRRIDCRWRRFIGKGERNSVILLGPLKWMAFSFPYSLLLLLPPLPLSSSTQESESGFWSTSPGCVWIEASPFFHEILSKFFLEEERRRGVGAGRWGDAIPVGYGPRLRCTWGWHSLSGRVAGVRWIFSLLLWDFFSATLIGLVSLILDTFFLLCAFFYFDSSDTVLINYFVFEHCCLVCVCIWMCKKIVTLLAWILWKIMTVNFD